MKYRKKLIEVALPLEAINRESAREKSIRHGHPSTLHLWWARRPLAACRAVLFAQLVDDPSSHPDKFPTAEAQEKERQRLFRIIEDLVKWENLNNERVLAEARAEIQKATGGDLPSVLDPFCGGGSIPLVAQRLGLEANASDLNPVAVLITKALVEIPPRFAGRPPVNPKSRSKIANQEGWDGAHGLAEDVRYYGQWMRDEAEMRIGHLYPKVKLPKEYGGGESTVVAWLWARTVKCPNPACGARMPLVRSFWLSTRAGKRAWINPGVNRAAKTVRFEVRTGKGGPPDPPKIGRGAKFRCIVCEQVADEQHIKDEGSANRMGAQLTAIVAEGNRRRIYLSPDEDHVAVAAEAKPLWAPDEALPYEPRAIWCTLYGLKTYRDLFAPRQLVALTTFSDLVGEVRERVFHDAVAAKLREGGGTLYEDGTGAPAYADAVVTYLGLGLSKLTDYNSSLVVWSQSRDQAKSTFARQALPMVWDFGEVNPFAGAAGDLEITLDGIAAAIERAPLTAVEAKVTQRDARTIHINSKACIFTDPPYYDNIGYADLSDFFYVWLRRSLGKIHPDLFSTLLTPKAQELVATPYRFGGDRKEAEHFFEEGLAKAFSHMREVQHSDYPLTLYYAFKQAESEEDNDESGNGESVVASTGWETMLEGLLNGGFAITGTWPMRTERGARSVGIGTNVLASSIVLVCRPRHDDAVLATRREFIGVLKKELPAALRALQRGNIAPVDMAQASIGPGMAVFSRYAKVLEADGSPMKVRTALQIINQALDEYLTQQEGEYDAETRWALAWFEQFGNAEGPFGVAETLSKAKNTSVKGMEGAGILRAGGGKVRLLKRDELLDTWDPAKDTRFTVWEATQYLIRTLEQSGEQAAADLLRRLGGFGEAARELAYRLYVICDRKRWAEEARAYNGLVVAWPRLLELAARVAPTQEQLGFDRRR